MNKKWFSNETNKQKSIKINLYSFDTLSPEQMSFGLQTTLSGTLTENIRTEIYISLRFDEKGPIDKKSIFV